MNLPRQLFRSRVLGAMTICVALAIVALSAEVASACPSCKAALANQGKGDLVKGFMYSILFMLSMPFALLGSFSGYMYVLVRRARREQDSQHENAEKDTPRQR